ncbi:hypothetical protein OC835_000592 [Tilletia horrida]|nr:hypothetical protein OC835_000592 [Tilletia horrida]
MSSTDPPMSFDESQLDPRLRSLGSSAASRGPGASGAYKSPEDIVAIPDHLLRAHPLVVKLEKQLEDVIQSRQKVVDHLRDAQAKLREREDAELLGTATASRASTKEGPSGSMVQNEEDPHSADEDNEAAYQAAKSLPRNQSYWFKEDCPPRASKETVIVNHLGSKVGKDRIRRIETSAALRLAFIFGSKFIKEYALPMHKSLAVTDRTFQLLSGTYLEVLIEQVCKPLEAEFPELKYCKYHYKSLLVIQAHIKAKLETLRKQEKSSGISSASTYSAKSQQRVDRGKNRTIAKEATTKSAKKRALSDDDEVDGGSKRTKADEEKQAANDSDFSLDDDQPGTSAPQGSSYKTKKQREMEAVKKLQALHGQGERYDKDSDSNSDVIIEDEPRKRPTSECSALKITPSSSAPRPSAFSSSTSKESVKGSRAVFAAGSSTAISQRGSSSAGTSAAGKNLFQAAAEGLAELRSNDASILVDPTLNALRSALKDRYSSLGKHEVDAIRAALRAIELAQACGKVPEGGADKAFTEWLVKLETAAEDPSNEDDFGPSFGHDAIGSYKYRDNLKDVQAWGGIKNAHRLLAAMLRLWAMSSAQIQRMGSQPNGPIARVHLVTVSELMCQCFKPNAADPAQADGDSNTFGRDLTNGSSARASGSTSASGGASSSAASSGPALQSNATMESQDGGKTRNRVAMELKNGKVTEAGLRTLSKKAALGMLGKNAVEGAKLSSKAQVLDMLVAAFKAGTVKPTAQQVMAARGGASTGA